MYKNRIKAWGLSKYLKENEAERILTQGDATEEEQRAAQRSQIRRRTREAGKQKSQHGRHQSNASEEPPPPQLQAVQQRPLPERPPTLNVTPPIPSAYSQPPPHLTTSTPLSAHAQAPMTDASFMTEPSPIQTDAPPMNWSAPTVPPTSTTTRHGSVSGVIDQFLINLRRWTHEAFVSRHWERSASSQHTKGRHASRLLASDLQAGIKFAEQHNNELAWVHWRRAVAHFQNRELFKTWYHETPVRLLFEVSRIHHSGYPEFAASLLRYISDWADQYLDGSDPRHALYKLYGKIPVTQLREVHERAATCMLEGLQTRLDKNAPLLFEIRLNRALDMIWFDSTADLRQWLPPLDEVDRACGRDNVFSVYYLLLQAYQLVAREQFEEADGVARQAHLRIERLKSDSMDEWRLGMAYRRLGRMQYQKGRYQDARRSFNTALRYVGHRQADSIMVEVFQCQESMAVRTGDREDAELWRQMLRSYEQKIKENEEAERFREGMEEAKVNGGAVNGTTPMEGIVAGMSPSVVGVNGDVKDERVASPTPLLRRETA